MDDRSFDDQLIAHLMPGGAFAENPTGAGQYPFHAAPSRR
jgi:hypothetical protein